MQAMDELGRTSAGNNALAGLVDDPAFSKVRDALATGELNYDQMRGLASALGRRIDIYAPVADANQGQLKYLYSALQRDIESAIGTRNDPGVFATYQRAQQDYAKASDTLSRYLTPTIGNKATANEQIVRNVDNTMKEVTGNLDRLKAIFGNLNASEKSDYAASLIEKMGTATVNGQPAFSPAKFLKELDLMSVEARRIALTDNLPPDLASAWDDLTQVILPGIGRGVAEKNTSRSAVGLIGAGQLGGALLTATTNPPLAALALLGPAVAAKALTSPAAVRTIARLSQVGSTAAQIANQVATMLGLQQAGAAD